MLNEQQQFGQKSKYCAYHYFENKFEKINSVKAIFNCFIGSKVLLSLYCPFLLIKFTNNHTLKKNKIVLYNPNSVFFDMPLALISLGSVLNTEEFNVIIIDARIDPNPHLAVLKEIDDAIFFGVTVLTGKPIEDAIAISRKVKEKKPNLVTVWGGWHPSIFPEKTLIDEKSVDITVQAQGEHTFIELIDAIQNNSTFESIKGITYRNPKGDIIKNPPRPMVNMDELPKLNYDLIDVEAYFKKKKTRQFDYITSIGCYFRCTFCADPHVFQRNFSAYSSERMCNEIEEYYKKYKFTDVNFQDETLFTYPKRILEFAKGLKDKNIPITWAGTLRADQGNRMSEENFSFLSSAGLRRVLIGVESGSQEMMDWLKKDIKIEHIYLCADRCMKNNINVIFPFIVGFPEESNESFDKSINMAAELNQMSPLFQTPIFYFKPYPGSNITDEAVRKGYKLPESLSEWSNFDYVDSIGPWVSLKKYQFVENFKFYTKVARSKSRIAKPLSKMAKWRLANHNYSIPLDKKIIQLFKPHQKLS